MKGAVTTPAFVAASLMGGMALVVSAIVVILGFRSMNMDDIRKELRDAARERARVERHLELIDSQNAESAIDRKKLNNGLREVRKGRE